MKKYLLIFCCIVLTASVKAQNNSKTSVAVAAPEALYFSADTHDFGKIVQGKPVTYVFEYTNKGKAPLVLTEVHASCGCTTPEWNRDTLKAGESSKITVGFNAASTGRFIKPITILYNDGAQKEIVIKGEVYEAPSTPAPQNVGVKILKDEK